MAALGLLTGPAGRWALAALVVAFAIGGAWLRGHGAGLERAQFVVRRPGGGRTKRHHVCGWACGGLGGIAAVPRNIRLEVGVRDPPLAADVHDSELAVGDFALEGADRHAAELCGGFVEGVEEGGHAAGNC